MQRASGARLTRRSFLAATGLVLLSACRGEAPLPPTSTPSPTTPPSTPTPVPSPTPIPTPARPTANPLAPLGFPIDPALTLGAAEGPSGSRAIQWDAGPVALPYSRDDQPSADPALANRAGWNARVHVAYEGQPAIDWYIPIGTPIYATMDGTATLLINTVSNPFDVYGVSREPYLGNPDRSRAPISPFPGSGGGQGVFVRVANQSFSTDYAHLDVPLTLAALAERLTFLPGFTPATEYASRFSPLRDYRLATAVATFPVRRGDLLGISGDTGYSEAPHLHYAIRRTGSANLLCPTLEPGFTDSGWLFRTE